MQDRQLYQRENMKVQFVLNVPETLALQDPSGLPCSKCRGIGASHNNSAAVPCDACGGTGKVAISKP